MANEVLVKLGRTASIGGQTVGGVDELVACDAQQVYRQVVPNGQTAWAIDFPVTILNNYVQAIHSNQSITVTTNAALGATSPAPTQTINLTKNVPEIWSINQTTTPKVFTSDVTTIYVSNTSGADALVVIGVAGKQAPAATA